MFESPEPMGYQGRKRVDPVLDPGTSAEARDRLLRKIQRADLGPDTEATGVGFAFSCFLAIFFALLHHLIGLSWSWMIILPLPIIIGVGVTAITAIIAFKSRRDDYYEHCVRASDLDEPSRELMYRTQRAIRGALDSKVYAKKSLKHAVEEPVLRRHEWEVAVALRKISKLRSELQVSTKAGAPGPMTAAVLESQRRALTLATDATTSRINVLKRYAAELEMADAAESDWQAAMKASGRNDQYLDLIARTVADEYAIKEIKGLTEDVAVAAQALNEHLYQASLAAQELVLPTTPQT